MFFSAYQFSRIVVALALFGSASAFTPSSFGARARTAVVREANVVDTLLKLEGPIILWGYDGPEQDPPIEESAVRGKDTFNTLIAAVKACNLVGTLSGPGPFTILAPTDSAFAALPKGTVEALLKDIPKLTSILTYHVIPGKVTKEAISGNQKTVNGATLTYKRFARQTYLDGAIIGKAPQGASFSPVFPVNVAADNGMIHVLDTVLIPGAYSETNPQAGMMFSPGKM